MTFPTSCFSSSVSIWEVAIKQALRRPGFRLSAAFVQRGLLRNGYVELPLTSVHALNLDALPSLHKDPFDRILLAQARSEVMTLLTVDSVLAEYPGPVLKV